jgi:outer membrane protein TolC
MLVKNNPELALMQAEYEIAEHAVELESRKQVPDVSVGVEYERAAGEKSVVVGPAFKVPIWNMNRQGLMEARAARKAAKAEFEALYEELTSRLARADIRLRRAAAQRENLEDNVAPLVETQVQEIHALAELGELDALLLLEVITRAHETGIGILEARREEAKAANQLRALLGPIPLKTGSPAGKE